MKKLSTSIVIAILPIIAFCQNLISVTPNHGKAGETLTLTITGEHTHFNRASGTSILFGFDKNREYLIVNSIDNVTPTTFTTTITIPSVVYTGDYDVMMFNTTDGFLSLDNSFHVEGIPVPKIKDFTPNTASNGQTLSLTITGENTHFQQGSETSIQLIGTNKSIAQSQPFVSSISAENDTTLNAIITIPENSFTDDYQMSVYNSIDHSISNSEKTFHVNGLTPPSLVSVSPNYGNNGQTLTLTITGANTHFNQGSETTLNFGFEQGSETTIINSIEINSATSLTASVTIPENTYTGDYDVSITNYSDGFLTLPEAFHVNGIAMPKILSASPDTVTAGETLVLTITGENTHFDQGSQTNLYFGFDKVNQLYVVNSIENVTATSLVANISIPSSISTGDYEVSIFDSIDGYLSKENAIHVKGIKPIIESISPNVANPGQTLTLTITGVNTHFTQASGTELNFGFNQISGTTVVNSLTAISPTVLIANITVPSNVQLGQYDVDLFNDIEHFIFLDKGFRITESSNLTGYVIPTNETAADACDGKAKVVVKGGTSPYTYLYSNESTLAETSGLCPGLYSVRVVDGNLDSLNLNFIITPNDRTFTTTNFEDSTLMDSLYSSVVSLCTIDYSNISSVTIDNYKIISNAITITWAIVYDNKTIYIDNTYETVDSSGFYYVALQLYCPYKTTSQYLTAYDRLFINASYDNLEEISSFIPLIYPNPFTNQITVSLNNNQVSEVSITDITGREIYTKKFNEKLINIDMNSISSGQYLITVKNNSSIITKKMIK